MAQVPGQTGHRLHAGNVLVGVACFALILLVAQVMKDGGLNTAVQRTILQLSSDSGQSLNQHIAEFEDLTVRFSAAMLDGRDACKLRAQLVDNIMHQFAATEVLAMNSAPEVQGAVADFQNVLVELNMAAIQVQVPGDMRKFWAVADRTRKSQQALLSAAHGVLSR